MSCQCKSSLSLSLSLSLWPMDVCRISIYRYSIYIYRDLHTVRGVNVNYRVNLWQTYFITWMSIISYRYVYIFFAISSPFLIPQYYSIMFRLLIVILLLISIINLVFTPYPYTCSIYITRAIYCTRRLRYYTTIDIYIFTYLYTLDPIFYFPKTLFV